MATATPRPSNASSRIRSKTSELSDLFRGRQHSSIPSPPADSSSKSKRKIPLFSLRKKSPAAPPGKRSPTLNSVPSPVPTPRPSTNVTPVSPSESNPARSQLPQLTIPSSSFSPLPSFDDASSSKRSSSSPTNSRSTRSITRPPSSQYSYTLNKSRTPTPTSAVALGGSFSDSEPPRSASVRTPTVLLRSYASDDDDRKYLSARILPPARPPPTTPLPPPPEDDPSDFGTPTSPGSPKIFFPGQGGPYDAKLSIPNGRKPAISMPRSPSHRFTSGSESASESAQGYTSASGSESAATGLGLGFRIRTRSGQGSGNDSSSTSRAASVRVGLLRTPNALTGSRRQSPPSPKSSVISLSKSSPPVLPTSERTVSPRPGPPFHSSAKRVSPPIQSATLKPPEMPGGKQPEPGTAASSTKHASWLVVPKAAQINPPGHASVQDSKVAVPSKLRARAASDSRTLTTAAAASIGANLPASSAVGASSQSITTTRSSPTPAPTSPSNPSKSPSTASASSTLTNRVKLGSNSPPPAEPLPSLPRSSISRASSESRSTSSPSSSESSTRTLTIPTTPSSASNALPSSGSGTVNSSATDSLNNLAPSASGSNAPSAFRSPPAIVTSVSGSVRRPRDDRPTNKDKNKDSTWSFRSGSKRSSPTVPSPLVQSHISSESPPYAPPSSFSASTIASQPPSSPQPPPSRVTVPIPPTPANMFALQTENANLHAEIASLRAQLENADRVVRRREREIRGLRWLVVNWSGDKKEEFGFTAFTERRPSGETTESQEEVQAAVHYLRAESESGYGSGSVSGSQSRLSHSSAYSSVYPAESVSDGSGSEVGITQRFGPGPSARASEDQALDAIPERTVIGGEDAAESEADRRKKDERRASRALKRLSTSAASDSSSGGLDKVVAQALHTNNLTHGPAMTIEQVIEGDRSRRERVGLKGMDEVLDKLRAAAGAKRQ